MQNSKTQIVKKLLKEKKKYITKLKNLNCDKTQIVIAQHVTKLKTLNVTKLQISKSQKYQKF